MRHRCSLTCKVHCWHLRRGNPDRAARDNDAGHDQHTCDHHTPTLRHDCLHAYATISHLRESRLKSGRKTANAIYEWLTGREIKRLEPAPSKSSETKQWWPPHELWSSSSISRSKRSPANASPTGRASATFAVSYRRGALPGSASSPIASMQPRPLRTVPCGCRGGTRPSVRCGSGR